MSTPKKRLAYEPPLAACQNEKYLSLLEAYTYCPSCYVSPI